ncbi:MAG: hypothetical protein DCC71_00135 [Proteobacteria bacterium]|nr:MAG: hypothetical protein DCC71_00135 [Pseudomonadota bacterium]
MATRSAAAARKTSSRARSNPRAPATRRAVVTGASSGIGLAFAEALARDGWDLAIVARRVDRLRALAQRLRRAHPGVRVDVVQADLTDAASLARLERRLAGDARLELLVNAAGAGTLGAFAARDPEHVDAEIRLDVVAVTRLTLAVLPRMLRRRRGAVINVSSMAAFQPYPYFAVYASAKAFLNSFTEALAEELRGTGVRVQALCPGLTHTEIFEIAGADVGSVPGLLWMEPDAVVQASLAALRRGAIVCVPGLPNRAVAAMSRLAPRELSRRIASLVVQRYEPHAVRGARTAEAARRRRAAPLD